MKINIIIQRTFNGLKTEFKSADLNLNSNDIENMFSDEQNAAQLANSSIIYTVENQNKYRIYSYINSNIVDNAGRAGYYAIRILISTEKILVNLDEVFTSIKERYEHYVSQKNLVNLDYSQILAGIISANYLLDKSVLIGSKKNDSYYLKYNMSENVDDIMNEDSAYLIKKLYLFAKDQSKSDEIIQQSGFKSFEIISSHFKKVSVSNPDRYLSELKINDENLRFPSSPNFSFFALKSDKITYKDYESKKEKPFDGTTLNISKPIPKPKPVVIRETENSHKKNSDFSLKELLISGAVALAFGSAVSWALTNYFMSNDIEKLISEKTTLEHKEPLYFTIEGQLGDLVFSGEKIENFGRTKFKFDSKTQNWQLDDGSGKFENFDENKLGEIAKAKGLDISKIKNALEKISGKTISYNNLTETSDNLNNGNVESGPSVEQNNASNNTKSPEPTKVGKNSTKNSPKPVTAEKPNPTPKSAAKSSIKTANEKNGSKSKTDEPKINVDSKPNK